MCGEIVVDDHLVDHTDVLIKMSDGSKSPSPRQDILNVSVASN